MRLSFDIHDGLIARGRTVDGKCGLVGGPCRASHAQALRKSEEPRIQGHHCPTQTSKQRGVVTWATKRGDTGRLGVLHCDGAHPIGGFEVIRQPRLDDLGN